MTVNLCRIIVALTFIFSGFVKAIDPIGLQYKLQDYLGAIGIPGFLPDWLLLIMAVLLVAVEFCMGIFLLFAIQRRLISKLIVVFMSIMTLITVWLVVANPVKDCGCFGDALHLTNPETLVKNIILLGCSIVIMQRPLAMFRFISESNQWIVINYTIVFIFVSSGLSLYYLPLFDFRPYRIGTNIPRGMEIPKDAEQPLFETTFIMEKGGQRKEFTLNDYPDSTWKFIDSKTVQVKEGYIPPIHDFSIADRKTGKDLTDSVLRHKGYTFLLIAPYLERADDSNFGDIDQLYEYAQTYNIPFYCLTASTAKAIQRWRDITGAEYPFCITDETTLKTIVRSNPGLLLLKDGTIINKWSHNQLPNGAKLSLPITQSALGKMPQDSVPGKILEIILWFILPLTLLTLADRLWAWSKWVRLKEKKDKQRLYQLFNKKKSKMRKKIVAGNWKMNLNLQEGIALAKEINEAMTAEKPNCDVVICTPFIHLASVAQVLNADLVGLGAENCADKEKGAFTGEVSAEMVKSTGAQYVILGHSERRQYYGETAEILKEKVQLALKHGLKVIFCCGETLEERESNRQNAVVKAELDGSVFNLTAEEWKNIVLAYEPIWAIGTGKTATSDQAEEMLCYIRSIVAEKYGKEVAEETSILYGGSCKASNAPELFSKPNIDGGLIGGASLKAADFKGIIDAWKK
ncbi:MAG: BT_3928 family protein [Segatella oris]|uniref:BT_3928 family protein n=1 Tax=Segatella oris TaxID=28135 RepID=UPI003FA235EC